MGGKSRLPHTAPCRARSEEASKDDKKVKLSARRADEFAGTVIEADATRRETEKKARKEKEDDTPKPTAEPGDGPNKKPRISPTTGSSSSTMPAASIPEASVE